MKGPAHVLLVTFPLDREGFVQRYHAGGVGDVIRFWSHEFADDSIDRLWPIYARVASRIEDVCRRSAALGVDVVRNAETCHLHAALQTDAPIALFAHWKSWRVFDFDVCAPELILQRLSRAATDTHLLVRRLVGARELVRLASLAHEASGPAVAAALDRIIAEEDLDPVGDAFDDDPDEYRQTRNRTLLDGLFAPALQPGNRLEMWDQMLDEPTFASFVPRHRRAGIDLAVCNSSIISRGLQFSCDCPILVNRRPAGILFRLDLYLQAISECARTGAPYVETVLRLRDLLLEDHNQGPL